MDTTDPSATQPSKPGATTLGPVPITSIPVTGVPITGATPTGSLERSSSQSSSHRAGHIATHRQSFAENQRHPPPSPRAQRRPSFPQQGIQELLSHPPTNNQPIPRFADKNLGDITLKDLGDELALQDDIRWVDLDTSVEEATKALRENHSSNVVLIRESEQSEKTAISTFDYSDLNTYCLVVVGLGKRLGNPDKEQVTLYSQLAEKAATAWENQSQPAVTLREIQPICRKEQLVVMRADDTLEAAMKKFGSGIHRIIIANQAGEVVGILSQLRLVKFLWNQGKHFPVIDKLCGEVLQDLHVCSHQVIAVNSDSPLADALILMSVEGLSSVAVVDSGKSLNVVGNISTTDVRHVTSLAKLPLLYGSCGNFTSVILKERGLEQQGRDSFPVFYVNHNSTLGHTVHKLVATQSHRMWVVESPSPSPSTSTPATPLLAPSMSHGRASVDSIPATTTTSITGTSPGTTPTILIPTTSPSTSAPQSPLIQQGFASSSPISGGGTVPGTHLSGRLIGVVSLTDILNLFARMMGLNPVELKRHGSSASSLHGRPSMDSMSGGRASLDLREMRKSADR